MVFYTYFFEIKARLSLLVLTWVTTVLVSYRYKETLLFLIIKSTSMFSNKEFVYFIFTDVTEIFSVFIGLVIFIGNQAAILYTVYHFWAFISQGLYRSEYLYIKFILKTVIFISCLFFFIFHSILLPFSWNFFLSFQNFAVGEPIALYFEAKMNEYLNFYLEFYYICRFYCQIIVFLIFFFYLIKNNFQVLKKIRKVFYYIFVIISTSLTPPDIFSQIVLSILLISSYELIIFYFILKDSTESFN